MLSSEAAAEDATQETFMRVHRYLQTAGDAREILGRIYRIATNYCLNEIRNEKTHHRLLQIAPQPVGASAEDPLADRDLVRRLVMRAPPAVRTAAWLYHVDGMKQEAIADVLGVSRRTVVSRLNQFSETARRFVKRESA
jgi:RNA polymerase sigma-70 factor (ECF subfamily)